MSGCRHGETGHDYTYTFRLSEGAVLEMCYDGARVTISEADLREAEAAGGAPAEAPRTTEELLHRGKIRARYLIYAEAPPPLPIRACPQARATNPSLSRIPPGWSDIICCAADAVP